MHPRRPLSLLALTLGLAASVSGAAPPAASTGFHYTREVEVPASGWVRVPLDLAAVQHLAPGAADLHVISPSGAELPVRIETAAPRSERRPVKPSEMEEDDDGWRMVFDVGAEPLPHERLFLEPAGLPTPERIESSADGSSWQPLTPGEPLRTEAGGGWASISYPATADRWLRLRWPRLPSQGRQSEPRVAAAEVESVTGPVLSIATRSANCEPGPPGAAFCTLPLPATGQVVRRLTVEVEGKGSLGYRLDAPTDGRWLSLAEGVWQRGEDASRRVLPTGAEPIAGDLLRLELYGYSQPAPRLVSYGFDLTVQTLLFRAGEPGRYTLAYGGSPRHAGEAPAATPGPEPLWLEAGPETEHPPPGLPASAAAPGVSLGTRRLKASWRVVAPSARTGYVVRLELPEGVYAAARTDLGNLRLAVGDRQIPYQLWSPAAPALALREADAQPSADGRRSRESTLELRLARAGLPLTELDLLAPPRPLRRNLAVRYLEPVARLARPPGGEPKTSPALRETWECTPQPPLPCRERLPLPGRAPSVLSVRFRDADNPPLSDLDAAVWRRRDVLVFVWPNADSVRLLVGPDSLRSPSYDLAALGDTLLGYPWQPAEISSRRDAGTGAEPWWSRWVRPMILVIAGVWLVALLRRILMEA